MELELEEQVSCLKDVHRGEVARKIRLFRNNEGCTVAESILDAIRDGQWDYEPELVDQELYDSTKALPGTEEKLEILASRVQDGLPLWHPRDRRTYDDSELI